VRHAKRCFEALIGRWLVMPVDVSAAGKVKSCMVDGQVHEFITKIASKEHILDARLSQLRARHFSTSSGLRLRASDSIDTIIVDKLSLYLHKLRLLKLLDLEGCHGLNKKHLKDICSNILQLKYLSLRGTDIDDLPSEINNLHDLEVLDIRGTNIPDRATRGIVLLKLRRLLAGSMDSSKILKGDEPLRSAVQIPQKINKMDNMEVLSNVIAYSKNGAELKEIRKLAHLRKLGVVINNKEAHLKNLLWAISDLKECIQSLSITILGTRNVGTHRKGGLLLDNTYKYLIKPPKVLQSLSLDGITCIVRLLTLCAKGSDELEKVTLRRTLLNEEDMSTISSFIPKLYCIRLRYDAYTEKTLTIKKDEFLPLKNFLVEHLDKTDTIKFEFAAAPELEKIVLYNTEIKLLCGVGALSTLKELELKGNKHLVILSSGEGTASAEPTIPEDGRAGAKPVISEDGRAPAKQIISEDGGAPERKIVGTSSTEPTTERTLSFNKEEFQQLKYFLIEGPSMQTNVKFEGGAPELEKIVLSDTNIESLVGVCRLAKLREIYLKGTRTLFFIICYCQSYCQGYSI
jgi:Leucine-rich repeat (LRR) protein